MSLVEVAEWWKGLHGGNYHFLVDGSRLVHLRNYAKRFKRDDVSAKYHVDIEELRGKDVIEFSSSRSGPLRRIWKFPAEDLRLSWDQRNREELPLEWLNGFELAHLSPAEKSFLEHWRGLYKPMLRFAKTFEERRSVKVRAGALFDVHILQDLDFPVSFMIPYSEKARRKSLSGLTKQIHQVWVALKLLDHLGFELRHESSYMPFEQSADRAVALIRGGNGALYGLWYELDLNPHTMFGGMAWYTGPEECPGLQRFFRELDARIWSSGFGRRTSKIPLRPDIAILEAKDASEACRSGLGTKIIIECKNMELELWKNDIEGQILPYKEIFKPRTMVVASIWRVPKYAKYDLQARSVEVIEEVCPGGSGEEAIVELVGRNLQSL